MKFSIVTVLVASAVFLISIQLISASPAQQPPGDGNNPGRPQAPGFQNAGIQGNEHQQGYQNAGFNLPPPQGPAVPQHYYPPVNRHRRFLMQYEFPDQMQQQQLPPVFVPVARGQLRQINPRHPPPRPQK